MNFLCEHPAVDLGGAWVMAFTTDPSAVCEFTDMAALRQSGLPMYPCTVPGNFELDLLELGLCAEPYYAANIRKLEPYEHAHIWYACTFTADDVPGDNALLTFEGLDCYATIYLNGEWLGATANMLIEHTFDVTGKLHGENELLVHITPALEAAKQYAYSPGLLAANNRINTEGLFVRKAQHMYGWDIMPRAVSAGLWRPVTLRFRPRERLEEVYLQTEWLDSAADIAHLKLNYRAHTRGGATDSYTLTLEACCGESTFSATVPVRFDAGMAYLQVEHPKLWWPLGSGEPHLYHVTVTLCKDGVKIDQLTFRHGIRTIELLSGPAGEDELDEFCFTVNGERLFIRGTCWVPADAYHSRDAARTREMFAMLPDLHCNMVRCWGGNVYENDLFFDLCDETGILVWQDFSMACAVYPHTPEFVARLTDEAVRVVKRLRQHASLALWCGDNECDMMQECFRMGDPNRNILTREVLPAVLKAEDPARSYLPSSPYLGVRHYRTGRPHPEVHIWIRATYYKSIRDWDFRFPSEIGYHGCTDAASIRQFISPEHLWPNTDNYEWQLHSTSPIPELDACGPADSRVKIFAKKIALLFDAVPDTLEEFVFASQAVQAEALKYFIELCRGTRPRRTGYTWWNLIDGWPQFSDAVVDYYFRKKLAYNYIRQAQEPLCVLIRDPEHGRFPVVACNDTREPAAVSYAVSDLDTGATLCSGQALALANSVTPLAEFCDDSGQHCYLITCTTSHGTITQHYLAGSPPFNLSRYRAWMEKAGVVEAAIP